MNIQSARKVAEFVQVLKNDFIGEGRPQILLVPGHQGRRYRVVLERNKDGLQAFCYRVSGRIPDKEPGNRTCSGNGRAVCYHVLASCLVAAEAQSKVLSWCDTRADAERLARIDGKVFTVKSAQSGASAWGVVREIEPEPKLAAAGLGKDELIRLAVEKANGKSQWYSGEILWLTDDAYLANDSGFVRLYQTYTDPRYPKYPQSKSLAIVFWLDPKAGCWKRYTADTAMGELFDDHDSAIPAQHTHGHSKLFKE